jgi:hypothetical protein
LAFHRELERAAANDHNVRTAEMPEPAAAHAPSTSPALNPTTLGLAAGTLETKTRQTSRARRGWLAAGFLGAAVVMAMAFFGLRKSQTPAAPLPAPPPTAVAAKEIPAPPAPAKIVTIEVENAPPGLHVTVDGVAKELPLTLPAGPAIHTLLFTAPGYESAEVRVDGTREHRSLVLAMKPLAPPAPEPEKKSPVSKKLAPVETAKAAPAKRADKKLRKAGRGAEMSEEFE